MVGWFGTAAFAAVGDLKSRSCRWRQVPYVGALAAVAVFIGWKFSQNREVDEARNPEEQKKSGGALIDELEVYEEDENVDSGARQPRLADQESERWISSSAEEMLKPGDLPDSPVYLLGENQARKYFAPEFFAVPNETAPGNKPETTPPDVVQHETDKTDEQVGDDFKDVMEDVRPAAVVSKLNRETGLLDTSILSMGAEGLDAFVSSRERSIPKSDGPNEDETGDVDNQRSSQIVEDVSVLESSSTVGDLQVDMDVVSVDESDADATNLEAKDFPMLSIKTGKSNRIFPTDGLVSVDWEQKVREEKRIPLTEAGQNSEEEMKPEVGSHLKIDDRECQLSQSTSTDPNNSVSSPFVEVGKHVAADVSFSNTKQSLPSGDHCSELNSSCPAVEVVNSKIGAAETTLSVMPTSSDDMAEPFGTAVRDMSTDASLDGACTTLHVQNDNEQCVQSPRSVKHAIVEKTDDELSNSARREYSERLRSYDEYLADPELSPTMRSQVLRAKASIARYFDDTDDDQ